MLSKLSGQLKFKEIFGTMRNLDTLRTTLDQDDRCLRVCEEVFRNENYAQVGDTMKLILESFRFTQAFTFITSYIDISQPNMNWDEFKQVGSGIVDALDALSFQNSDVVSRMGLVSKDKIAHKLASCINGWKYYLDHFEKDEERKNLLKTNILNQANQEVKRKGDSPTEKLNKLIRQYFPDYTMEKFFNACKECHYNDTLGNLMEICTANST